MLLRFDGARWQEVALPEGWEPLRPGGLRPVGLVRDGQGRVVLLGLAEGPRLHFARRVHEVWESWGSQDLGLPKAQIVLLHALVDGAGGRWVALARRDAQGDLRGLGVLHLALGAERARFLGPEGAAPLPGLDAGPALPSGSVTALAEAAGALWIGTRSGLLRVVGEEVTLFDENAGMDSESIQGIAAGPAGAPWIRTSEGLAQLEGERWRSLKGAAAPAIAAPEAALALGPGGELWVSAAPGLLRGGPAGWRIVRAAAALEGRPVQQVLFPKDGGPWVVQEHRLLLLRELD